MSNWTVVIGILGICGTWAWMAHDTRQRDIEKPQRYWMMGLAGILPAWFVAFIGLLGAPTRQGVNVSLPVAALFSSGVGLLGIVLTDAAVRRLHTSGRARRPAIYWFLGVVALVPAWCIALFDLLRR